VASRAFMEGYYYKPRCDWETLNDHSAASSPPPAVSEARCPRPCFGATRPRHSKAARFQEIFGRDNYYVELQDHGIPEQHQVNPQLLQIARKLNAPLLATNDSHYTHRHDAAGP